MGEIIIDSLLEKGRQNRKFIDWLAWVQENYLNKNGLIYRIRRNEKENRIFLVVKGIYPQKKELLRCEFKEDHLLLPRHNEMDITSYRYSVAIGFAMGFANGIYSGVNKDLQSHMAQYSRDAVERIAAQN